MSWWQWRYLQRLLGRMEHTSTVAGSEFYVWPTRPHGEPWSPLALAMGRSSWLHSEWPRLFSLQYNQPISSDSEVENLQRLLSDIKKKKGRPGRRWGERGERSTQGIKWPVYTERELEI